MRHAAALLLLAPALAWAGPSGLRTVGTAEGLSQSSVNAVLQDERGYLWFATQDGLNRFDGYTVRVYRHDPADSASLADNYLWRLAPARGGGFWVGTFRGGLSRYDPARDAFETFRHDPADSASLSEDNVTAVHEDADGTLWAGTWFGGLNRSDGTGRFRRFQGLREDSSSLSDNRVSAIVRDSSGRLWVGTWRGLNLMEAPGRFRRFLHDPGDPESLGGDAIWGMTVDGAGRIWIATWGGGLSMMDPQTLRCANYRHDPADPRSLASNLLRAVHADPDGTVWVGTYGAGVCRLTPDGTFERFPEDAPEGLPSGEIQSIYRDSRGMLWIGTASGVVSHDRHRTKFRVFRHRPGQRGTLASDHVLSVHVDSDGGLWVGTHGRGLSYRAPGSASFVTFRHDPDEARSLSSDLVTAVHRERDGTLWVGTRDAGLNRLRPGARGFDRIRHDRLDPASISSDDILVIRETGGGDLWVGTNGNGLNRLDRRTGRWIRHTHRPGDSASVSGHHIWSLAEASGTLWAGTWGQGLNRYDGNGFTRVAAAPGTILAMAPARTGLWLGTTDGLFRLGSDGRPVREPAELPSAVVYSILTQGDGTLWLGTGRGLVRYRPEIGRTTVYGVDDGLPGIEFMHGAAAAAPDGRLYFGGIDGLTAFQPDSIIENRAPPPVVITRVTVADREIPLGPSGSIELSHDDNFLTIEFAALDYSAPEHNSYEVRLEGGDRPGWVGTGTRRHVSFSQLGSGRYRFRVRGANSDGAWNADGASLAVTVAPAFWETLWFRGAGAALLAGLVGLLYRYRIRKLLELERMRIRIASDLHDEVGSSLTKIALYTDLLREQGGGELIGKIGALSRETVSTMSDIVWSIDARNDTVGDLLDRMREMAVGLLEPRQIEFELQTSGLDAGRKLPVDLRENLYLIFKEAVTNAAKYSGASRVRARLAQSPDELVLAVEDDGRGLDGAGRGQGLRNMEMRARRIGARWAVDGSAGVRITVSRPPI